MERFEMTLFRLRGSFGFSLIKSRGLGISLSHYKHGPWLLSLENRRKIEPKEIPSCLIPHLLVVFTWQLEILVTNPRIDWINYYPIDKY